MRFWLPISVMLLGALLGSCSKQNKDLPTSFMFVPPATPTDVVVTPGVERSTVTWRYETAALANVKEFRVYEFFPQLQELVLVGATKDTVFVDSLLVGNLTYCYKVSAVDTTGFEGYRTAAECAFVRASR